MSDGVLIAQITDTHIGFDRADASDANLARFDRVLGRIEALARRPDMLLVTGDLTENGDAASYRLLRARLAACPIPSHFCIGNHDTRDTFLSVFPETPTEDGFVQYELAAGPLRILVLDTVEPGRHGGAFCAARAEWLARRLATSPDRPTIIVLHHPPVDQGIAWIAPAADEPWIARLEAALAGGRGIVALLCGHVHRPIATLAGGRAVLVCPSTAPPLKLDLSTIDLDRADGRVLVTDGAPGFALHLWRGGALSSHFEWISSQQPLLYFDPVMEPLMSQLRQERT